MEQVDIGGPSMLRSAAKNHKHVWAIVDPDDRDGWSDLSAVILATGARPLTVPAKGLMPDGNRVWTYREAMVPEFAPQSIAIVGSGSIGIEFASFYRALGTAVVVVVAFHRLHIPSSLGYLLVGVLLGSYTPGPVSVCSPSIGIRICSIVSTKLRCRSACTEERRVE